MERAPILAIRDLSVSFDTPQGEVPAVRGVSLDIAKGETVLPENESVPLPRPVRLWPRRRLEGTW